MLRNGRLLHLQSIHNLSHGPLLQGEVVEYLSPPRLRHSIKSVRGGGCSCHASTIHSDMGICQALFLPAFPRCSSLFFRRWISLLSRDRLPALRRCAVICALLLALSLSPWLSPFAQAPDSPKQEAPPPQEAPKPKVMRIRIGGNVAKSQLKHKVQPRYPEEARDNRMQGTVRLHVVLSTDGKVQQLDIVSGDPVLA